MTQGIHSRPTRRPHPRRRQAVVTWLGAYPTITAILAAFKPVGLMSAPLPVRTLVLTLIAVPLTVFVLTPTLMRVATLMQALHRRPSSGMRID